jgi:hypothetical protein
LLADASVEETARGNLGKAMIKLIGNWYEGLALGYVHPKTIVYQDISF